MWPKVIAQLFELLPHVSRLVPMADRFFSSKEVKRARLSMEQHEHRMESLELQVTAIGRWVKGGVAVLVVMVGAAIVILVRGH